MKAFPVHREISDQLRMVLGGFGCYLIVFGIAACIWSVRAGVGQWQYANLLMKPSSPEVELQAARRSFRSYSRNYALCIRAAETAYKAMQTAATPDEAAFFEREAEFWVNRGMNLNPRLVELNYIRAQLLARQSPKAALEAWEKYVNWHFWNPRNLEILAKFQEKAGLKEEAEKTRWLRSRR